MLGERSVMQKLKNAYASVKAALTVDPRAFEDIDSEKKGEDYSFSSPDHPDFTCPGKSSVAMLRTIPHASSLASFKTILRRDARACVVFGETMMEDLVVHKSVTTHNLTERGYGTRLRPLPARCAGGSGRLFLAHQIKDKSSANLFDYYGVMCLVKPTSVQSGAAAPRKGPDRAVKQPKLSKQEKKDAKAANKATNKQTTTPTK